MAERRHPAVGQRAQALEQGQRSEDAVRRRRLEPVERLRSIAGGDDAEEQAGEIEAVNLGIAGRPQAIARVPEPAGEARAEPRGAAGALIGAVLRHALQDQRVDGPLGIVSRHLVEAGVHHGRDARHGQRGLGDVGGEDDAARARGLERAVLRLGVERAVQRHERRRMARGRRRRLVQRAFDVRGAGQEDQHVARRPRQHRREGLRHTLAGRVLDGQRVADARHLNDRTVAEVGRDGPGIERRRHHHDTQVVAGEPGLLHQRQPDVGVDAPLVELVQDDRRHVTEQRVVVEVGRQHALGDQAHARLGPEAAVEADVPADLAAGRPALLLGDAPRDAARRQPTGLQHDDGTTVGDGRGTRVVLPAPGAATTTTARAVERAARMAGRWLSMGRAVTVVGLPGGGPVG